MIAGNENSKFTTPENPLRMWGVQGYDSVGMVEQVTKYASRVTDPSRTLYEIEKAAHITQDKRPGPVWVEVPMNMQAARLPIDQLARFTPESVARLPVPAGATQRVIEALRKAERPLLWLGHGIRLAGAADELPDLLDALDVPALVTWAGIDMIDSEHPRVIGRAGVYGQRAANFALQNCDYILAIGTRLAIPQVGYDLSELARGAVIDVVDIDADEGVKLGARVRDFIHADAGNFVHELSEAASAGVGSKAGWISRCDGYRRDFPWVGTEHADPEGFINSYRFMERLNGFFKPDQLVVTDMGTALLCGHQVLKFVPANA